jgi:hypothetical protein
MVAVCFRIFRNFTSKSFQTGKSMRTFLLFILIAYAVVNRQEIDATKVRGKNKKKI